MHLPDQDEGHMLSFNHYAYGAVLDWVFRALAGLAPDPQAPGYRHVLLAPRPVRDIEHVTAAVDTAFGRLAVEWTVERTAQGEEFAARYSIPFGVTATFDPPGTEDSIVTIDGEQATGEVTMGPGEHEVRLTNAAVVDRVLTSLP
jgi:alpha-L-rhamnosidase